MLAQASHPEAASHLNSVTCKDFFGIMPQDGDGM